MHSWMNSGGVSSRGARPWRANSANTVSLYLDGIHCLPDRRMLQPFETLFDNAIDTFRIAVVIFGDKKHEVGFPGPLKNSNKQPVADCIIECAFSYHVRVCALYCSFNFQSELLSFGHPYASG